MKLPWDAEGMLVETCMVQDPSNEELKKHTRIYILEFTQTGINTQLQLKHVSQRWTCCRAEAVVSGRLDKKHHLIIKTQCSLSLTSNSDTQYKTDHLKYPLVPCGTEKSWSTKARWTLWHSTAPQCSPMRSWLTPLPPSPSLGLVRVPMESQQK